MTEEFMLVRESEQDEPVELPLEVDGTLLLSTLVAQFPGATGLKFRNVETGAMRAVRLADNYLHPPDLSWQDRVYLVNNPRGGDGGSKRRAEEIGAGAGDTVSKITRRSSDVGLASGGASLKNNCTDLICLNLSWDTTEADIKSFFEKFGDVIMAQIKRDNSGSSRGYGFIRFADIEGQCKALSERHMMDGRWVDVKIPNSKGGFRDDDPNSKKIFIGRVTPELTEEILREFFSRYGTVTEVFVPKPFRSFAFLTFKESGIAQSLLGEDLVISGASVHIGSASPKPPSQSRMINTLSGNCAGVATAGAGAPMAMGATASNWGGGMAGGGARRGGWNPGQQQDVMMGAGVAGSGGQQLPAAVGGGGGSDMVNLLSNLLSNPGVLSALAHAGNAGAGGGNRGGGNGSW